MNDIFAAWLWCVLQVTLVGMLSAGAYLTVKRRWPRSAEGALLAGLALPILLTFTIFSPWPCWIAAEAPPAMAAPAAPQRTSAVVSADASVSPAGGYAPTPPAVENPDVVPASATPVPGDQAVPVAATPSPPSSPAIGLAVIAAVLAIGGLRLLIGWAAIRRVIAGSRPVDDAELQQLIAALLSKLRTRRCVVVRESASLRTAATVGWRRPIILLPDAWRTWSAGELRAVLAHELAHVSRGHFGAWIIAQCGLSLHVYHPLLHWLAARLRLEQEYEADALAAAVAGGPTAYVRTLAELALQQPEPAMIWPARAFLARPGAIVRRIQRLQQPANSNPPRWPARIGVIALLLCGGIAAAGLRGPSDVTADAPGDNAALIDGDARTAAEPGPLPALAEAEAAKDEPANDRVTITGRVTDPDGNPAAGAMVVLPINFGWGGTRRDVAQSKTATDGTYAVHVPVAWLATRQWRWVSHLWVYQRGFGVGTANVFSQLSREYPDTPVNVELPPESRPSYRIVDESNRPVSGVRVEIRHYDDQIGNSHYLPQEFVPLLIAESDATGNVVVPGVAKGKLWRVRVLTPDHGVQGFRVSGKPDGAELQLKNAVPLRGRLNADNPEWARNVRLRILSGADNVDVLGGVGEAEVTTDANGMFEIPWIREGQIYPRAHLDPDLPVRLYQSTTLRAPADPWLGLYLVPATRVRGRIVRRDNRQPLENVELVIQHGAYRDGHRVRTDREGWYESRVLPGNVYLQVVDTADPELLEVRPGWDIPYDVPESADVFELPTIELYPTDMQPGRLIDADDQPVAGYTVWGSARGRGHGGADATNGAGEFELRLPRGIEIESYGYDSPNGRRGTPTLVSDDPLVLRTEPGSEN